MIAIVRRLRSTAAAVFLCSAALGAQDLAKTGGEQHKVSATDLAKARISLARGLAASERRGKPISAKYEMEEGKLQLSVYTAKASQFSEVIVNHRTGKVTKTEQIKEGDDLRAATAQSEAMAKARLSLRAAVTRAVKGNPGYRAVSVVPSLKDGKAAADVTLLKGEESKTVTVQLN